MNQDTTLQQEASVREARFKRRQLLRVFDTPDGRETLSFLEARFQTDLPVFSRKSGELRSSGCHEEGCLQGDLSVHPPPASISH